MATTYQAAPRSAERVCSFLDALSAITAEGASESEQAPVKQDGPQMPETTTVAKQAAEARSSPSSLGTLSFDSLFQALVRHRRYPEVAAIIVVREDGEPIKEDEARSDDFPAAVLAKALGFFMLSSVRLTASFGGGGLSTA
ncbi:MAG: hypothetical protein AAGN64_11360 [Bacteroidota bacterium]